MKKIVFSAVLFFAGFMVSAQQDAQFTQYMFNKVSFNPAAAGYNGKICGTLLYRTQWTGFEGAPKTVSFSGEALLAGKHGVGLTVFQDQLGIESNFTGKLAYSFRLNSAFGGPGNLAIGLEVGLVNKSFGSGFIAIDDYTQDPSIPNSNTSAMTFDAGFGLFYNIPNKLYVGISSLHIPETEFSDISNTGDTTTGASGLSILAKRHYYITAGYEFRINQTWVLKPSILAKTDIASTQLDINAMIVYNDLLWGGITYRLEDAIAVLVGVNIPKVEGLKVGFSYDYTTSSLNSYSNGSLEFMVKYCTSIDPKIKRTGYKSVRFL